MKKIVFTFLAVSALLCAAAQTRKCGIDTKALVADEIAAGATHIDMLAKMARGFDRGVLEKAGIVIGTQAGQIVTLSVPVASLALLESNKEVLLYSISHPIARPECDQTRADTRADSAQNGWGVTGDTAITGKGVYIGITDWGFDYTHPNYNHLKKDNFRLLMAWDHFRLSGPAPSASSYSSGLNYGTLMVGRRTLLDSLGDTSNIYGYGTHGTHVAGIAAGRGVNGKYTGQAPYANLLFCTFGLGEKQWMDAVGWMREVAQDSAKRLVINSSWGMYSFSCLDGHSLLSEAINSWSDEGIVFCTSAGNNGAERFHTSYTFTADSTDTLRTVATWFRSTQATGQVLILWGEEGHDFSVAFGMKDNTGVAAIDFITTAIGDTVIDDTLFVEETAVPYRAYVEHENPYDQRPHIQLEVGLAAAFELQLYITADSGTVHAWNVANKTNHAGNEGCEFSTAGHAGFTAGDNYYGVGEPACAQKCISVAAHEADYWNTDHTSCYPGGLAYFSSYGPLIDGTKKPEISAPGYEVVSSINHRTDGTYTAVMSKNILDTKYIWSKMSGTSMSSPAVTGVVALLLEANPNLTVDQIRNIIFTTARNDSKTGPLVANDSMDVRWGWGKIDALKAVNKALSMVNIEQVEQSRTPLRIMPNPASAQVIVNTGCGEPQTLGVYAADGHLVYRATACLETTLDLRGWHSGIYFLRVGSRTGKLIVK